MSESENIFKIHQKTKIIQILQDVNIQILYSQLKEIWKTDKELIKYSFPMQVIDKKMNYLRWQMDGD